MVTAAGTLERETVDQVDVRIVDSDVHLVPQNRDEILVRMPEPWRSSLGSRRSNNSSGKEGYAAYGPARRLDSFPESGNPPGSEPEMVYQQLLQDAGVDLAILVPEMRYTGDPAINAALAQAFNTWVAETWLDKWNLDNRFFGTISVSLDDPARAVREIETWAEHPSFKQILISNYSDRPLGFPQYDRVWEAAARHGLPVAMHNTAYAGGLIGLSAVGRIRHWVDFHAIAFPLMYSAHLVSWITGGVFDRYPELRVVFVEGGYLWHRPIVSRLARHWDSFRLEHPAAKGDPFDYVRENVRFTTQPIEEHESAPQDVARLMELAEANRTLLFSSDYPHHDYDDPKMSLPRGITKETRQRVMCENARELYGLPRTRRATPTELGRAA
jgi:predicted TIM-barrel fold metal-dependent hydrolase